MNVSSAEMGDVIGRADGEPDSLESLARAFGARVEKAIADNTPQSLPDDAVGAMLTAALRAYAFKADKAGQYVEPYPKGTLTVTETVVGATAIIRAADLNLWDLAMWFNRPTSAPIDNRNSDAGGGQR